MHEGHRRRMYEKLKSGDRLYDHEVLEMLLFNAYQRTNTNPIAHSLLKAFGSIQGVFEADVEKLVTVEGVGENVALYLKVAGECFLRASGGNGAVAVRNYSDFKDLASKRLRGHGEEILELYFLDRNGKIVYISTNSSGNLHKVDVSPEKISGMISVLKPYGVFVAHNHLGNDSNPSENDDEFTRGLMLICKLNNVKFYDHIIYASDNNMFSYYSSGKIDAIFRTLTIK